MRKATWLPILGVVGALFVFGCETVSQPRGPDPASESGLGQGLSVLESTDTSIAVAYRKGDIAIYMTALRGKLQPEMYQKGTTEPRYEIDARFDADNGRTFYSRKGGDQWIDPSWPRDFTRQNSLPPSPVSNEGLFQMAAEASALIDTHVPAKLGAVRATALKPVLTSLREFGKVAPATFAAQKAQRIEMQLRDGMTKEEAVRGEIAYGSGGPEDPNWENFGANYYYIAVHDMTIYGFGKHSATVLYQWLGYWGWVHDSCNHGDCASSMGIKCLLQYYEAVEDYKPAWTLQNCATGYDWDSDDGHNCHDDTRLQMNNFVYGGPNYSYNSGWDGWCNDGDSDADISVDILFVELDQDGSPDCNGSTNRGYNHPWWNPYYVPPAAGSGGCWAMNACGGYATTPGCWCDSYCVSYGDCCFDGPC